MLLRELDAQAREEGGAVYMLNGNHESLNVCGDFRYATPGGFREAALAAGLRGAASSALDAQLRARLALYAPGGPMALELALNPTVLVVGRTMFAHGGIMPSHVAYGLEKLNGEENVFRVFSVSGFFVRRSRFFFSLFLLSSSCFLFFADPPALSELWDSMGGVLLLLSLETRIGENRARRKENFQQKTHSLFFFLFLFHSLFFFQTPTNQPTQPTSPPGCEATAARTAPPPLLPSSPWETPPR